MTEIVWVEIRYDHSKRTIWEGQSIRKKYRITKSDDSGVFDLWSYAGYIDLATSLDKAKVMANEHAAKGRKKCHALT